VRVAEDVVGTVAYGAAWWVLAVALLGAVVAWNVGLALWGRPSRVHPDRPRRPHPAVAELRRRCLADLDQIEAREASGHLSTRQAHQQLSRVVRRFVQEATGVPASAMTLASLREQRVPGLLEVIELVYPAEFAPGPRQAEGELAHSLARAREVVRAPWS
jgi:hypothetical protein